MAGQPQNMEFGIPGGVVDLDVKFRQFSQGPFVDDDRYAADGVLPTVEIFNPGGDSVYNSVSGAYQPVRETTGQYHFPFTIPANGQVSDRWKIVWHIQVNNQALQFEEFFRVSEPGSAEFGNTEYRVGFAFENPDLTSSRYAPGWGLLLTADEQRYINLFGTRLVSPDASQTYDDKMLMYYNDAAIAIVERDLDIDIYPRIVRWDDFIDPLDGHVIERDDIPADEKNIREMGYPYRSQAARHYLYIRLRRRPLQYITYARMIDPINRTLIDLMPWRREFKGLDSRLQFFPNLTAIGNYPFFSQTLMQARYPFNDFPDAFKIDYVTGWPHAKDVPLDLRELVRLIAGIMLLNDFGDGKSPGLASSSVNLNSVSESFTTTQSATNALYGARIGEWKKQIKEWMATNAGKYRRNTIGVL